MKTGTYLKFQFVISLLVITLVFASSCTDFMFNPPVKGNGILATAEREASEFSEISYGIPGKLILKKGSTPSIVIEADENIIPLVETRVVNNRLNIKTKENLLPGKNGLTVCVTIPDIRYMSVNGSGNIRVEDVFQTGQLSLKINGSGNISMETEAEKLNSRINGSGGIDLKGYSEIHTIDITGSGSVMAYDAETLECSVKVMGSGNSYVTVTEDLDVHIMGSGNVYVKGSPLTNVRTQGSGKVIKVQ